jgi:hypothetical protein
MHFFEAISRMLHDPHNDEAILTVKRELRAFDAFRTDSLRYCLPFIVTEAFYAIGCDYMGRPLYRIWCETGIYKIESYPGSGLGVSDVKWLLEKHDLTWNLHTGEPCARR